MRNRISRRLLLSSGIGSLALPFLPSLSRGQVVAAPPLRLILFFNPNGSVAEHFWPTPGQSETDFSLGSILEPLSSYKSRMLLAHGINSTVGLDPANLGGPHQRGIGGLFTGQMLLEGEFQDGCGSAAGWANGPSIDQVIAAKIGADTPFSSLELGVRANVQDVQGRISYLGPGSPLPATNDPVSLYSRLFSIENDGTMESGTAASNSSGASETAVLDAVRDQLALVRRRLGAEDRATLDRHLTMVEDLERRMQVGPGGGCNLPDPPTEMDVDSETTMPLISRAQLDLLAHAIGCDLTRVASVQYSTGFNLMRYPWVDDQGEGHPLSHSGDSNVDAWSAFAGRLTWHAGEIAYLMDRLAEMPEGDGSVLDNTVILWGTEISRGNTHSLEDLPYLLLGDAGGKINSGRFLTYDGASNCDYLHAILAAFGVDLPGFGHPDHSHGILSGILS